MVLSNEIWSFPPQVVLLLVLLPSLMEFPVVWMMVPSFDLPVVDDDIVVDIDAAVDDMETACHDVVMLCYHLPLWMLLLFRQIFCMMHPDHQQQ